MIDKKQVKHIVKLARLAVSEKEIEKYQKELSKILDYINLLKEVNVQGVKPTTGAVVLNNVMREDKAESENAETVSRLIEAAPDKERGYVRVKQVLK